MSDCLIIFNPTAGPRRRRKLRAVLAALREAGVATVVCETVAPGDAERIAHQATGYRIVAAAGGDGTINEVLNGLRRRADPCVLAIIPLGTANVLARELGLDRSPPEDIAAAIAANTPRPVALGTANGRSFVMMAGVGFDAHVVANVDVRVKRRIGKFAYVAASLAELVRYRARTYEVNIDGRHETASSVVIANGHFYGGPYVVAPEASLDDPLLQVCLFRRTGRWNAIRYLWGLVSGRLGRFPDFDVFPATHLTVRAGAQCGADEPVQGDGDIVAALPVDLAVVEGGLPVARPV
ncbi:MAG: diacylglycerol kinase family lipid kinase [Alphaproteobacteria bacterium]|nr:diacylglycerol kinase family lipid kinase [Alphaproteobacteria bacterium]